MTWEPRPVPAVTPETAAFWAAAAEGTFLLSECRDCGLVFHYPRHLCPDCFGDDVAGRPASGTGEVYTHSAASSAAGWPEEELPVVVAMVELAEGPRVMTNVVDCDPADVSIGDRVAVDFVPTEDPDVAVPVFRLAE